MPRKGYKQTQEHKDKIGAKTRAYYANMTPEERSKRSRNWSDAGKKTTQEMWDAMAAPRKRSMRSRNWHKASVQARRARLKAKMEDKQ